MARRGRKRKIGIRHPGGTLVQPRFDVRDLATLQPHRVWLPEEKRMDQKAASPLGCLNLLGVLTDQMRTQQQLMTQLAETQGEVRPLLTRLTELARSGGFGIDESSRNHLRNMDLQMNRLLEELTTGRQVSVQELTREIRMVARTIAAIAEESQR